MKFNELTIKQAKEKLQNKEISALELTQACIERIQSTEESLNSLLALNFDQALKQAKEIDQKRIQGHDLGELAGIPCTIKDMLLTKGLETTAASNMLRNYVPVFEATAVEKLKKSGAIILAKNNCDAWAHGSSTENSDYGPTKNPWDLDRVPGGSSGGSAASVAADQCLFSIGTDTGGSIRQPAAYCGVVGLKPTYGRVSRYGVVAMGSSLDCVGPITKTVEDGALVLSVISGQDKKDATTLNKPIPQNSLTLTGDLNGITIGVPDIIDEKLSETSKDVFDKALNQLKDLGAEIKNVSLKYLEYGIATYYIIMPSEVSSNLGRYDGLRYGNQVKDAKDLLDMYLKNRGAGFGAEAKRRIMIGTYVLSAGYYEAYYKKAMKVRTLIKNEFDSIFKDIDILAMPTTQGPAFKLGEKVDDPLSMYLEDIFTVTANIAGIPGISIPSGTVDNLPVGLQLLTAQFQEDKILRVAGELERKINFTKNIVL